jgi:hypothetical protein
MQKIGLSKNKIFRDVRWISCRLYLNDTFLQKNRMLTIDILQRINVIEWKKDSHSEEPSGEIDKTIELPQYNFNAKDSATEEQDLSWCSLNIVQTLSKWHNTRILPIDILIGNVHSGMTFCNESISL